MTKTLAVLFVVAVTLGITVACDGPGGATALVPTEGQHVPVISGISANPFLLKSGDPTRLTAVATDADGDSLTYTWSCPDGIFNFTTRASVIWTAPNIPGDYHIKCTVSDGAATAEKTLILTVSNAPPVISSITVSLSPASAGESVTFSGSATDAEDGSLTGSSLVWTSDKDGPIGTGQSYSTSSLSVNTHVITLTATDSDGETDTASLTVGIIVTGTLTDIDGNVYLTVTIGTQEWMAENLRVTKYRDGSAIPTGLTNSAWHSLSSGAYAAYDNNERNASTYGYLYNWFAVDDNRSLAPAGWHVPSDDDWKELEMYLGMSLNEANSTGWRGTDEGGKLKETGRWNSPNIGATNTSGFTALPGGYRIDDGRYLEVGEFAHFWSSTEFYSSVGTDRYLGYDDSAVYRGGSHMERGFSVRLVRDR